MKVAVCLLVLLLVSSVVIAANPNASHGQNDTGGPEVNQTGQAGQNQTGNQTGQGTGQGQQIETRNQGEEGNLTIQTQQRVRARNVSELRNMIQERSQEMNQELKNLTKSEEKVYKNQNTVRLAVHSLLAMENLTGGIGKNISQIAREFNNSVRATIKSEEKIQNRNRLVKFLFGGDDEAAGEMEQEVNQNQERIQNLKQLKEKCNCTEEVNAILQEQIQNMEQEQNRLQELAQNEKKSKGLFGWLWK